MAGCSDCIFFRDGLCKRFPPVRVANGDSKFPHVSSVMWCGEYKKAGELNPGIKIDANSIPPARKAKR